MKHPKPDFEANLNMRKNSMLKRAASLASGHITRISKIVPKDQKSQKGQSFLELTMVIVFLMIFVAGIVEFGFMLNNYLNLVDASREAVRYSADGDPFDENGDLDTDFFVVTGQLTEEVMAPVVLDPSLGDDIVISFFSVGGGVYERYPNAQGWSVHGTQTTKFSDAEIQSRLDGSAPPTGVLLIEIFYNYPQVLKLPVFTAFVRDPMPVYAYAVMPLTAAEPLVTEVGGGGGGIPTPTATTFVCDVDVTDFYRPSSKVLAVDITNNTGLTLHYDTLTIYFNSNSPSGQKIRNVKNAGSDMWSGNTSSSPLSISVDGEVPPGETVRLSFHFRYNYSITGVEHLLLEFEESGCPTLDVE